uniref:Dioxygenase n=1 Tax=Rhizochromulina marina TaxID=1034831 RepID=A0A7S2S5X2_9STRA
MSEDTSVVRERQGDQGVWDREAWIAGYNTPREEQAVAIQVENLPEDIRGTYYRNGPGLFEVAGDRYQHPFDCDGMVLALSFVGNSTVHFRNRFVRTQSFQKEKRAGKRLFPGSFGNARPFWANGLSRANRANTNAVHWGGRLLALWEGGQPYKLDPISLGTAGATDLLGMIKPSQSMTAHPRVDSSTNRLVGFGYDPSPVSQTTSLRIFEFDEEFRPLGDALELTVPAAAFFHDFVVTKNYYVFTLSPIQFDVGLDALLGGKPIGQCLRFDESKPTSFLFVPRGASAEGQFMVDVDTHFNFHYANAYEDDTGRVVIDTVRADRLELGGNVNKDDPPLWETTVFEEEVPQSLLYRYVVNPSTRTVEDRRPLTDRSADFPVVNSRVSCQRHRYVYMTCGASSTSSSPPQGMLKVDVDDPDATQVWLPPPGEFCGEPTFIPRQDSQAEDDGYVVTVITRGKEDADLALFDARRIADGPICRASLGTNVPHGLHGCWAPDVQPSLDDIRNAGVLLRMFERKSKEWNQVEGAFSGLGIAQFFGQKGVDGR